ncbi:insulin-like growth factor binding proteinn-terminal [Anaeramoeba flamelloides]|uniref:Insulin-like growth factor binding proteinn-terminal n=1 Tax=Anaeramoeba flamelloides TaxID=1746091 RepID=A0AAV7ZIE3_9EUKA|nr:insulin-like growth factor binding proteinn-terminal [Anaeramoeba flamelloides]
MAFLICTDYLRPTIETHFAADDTKFSFTPGSDVHCYLNYRATDSESELTAVMSQAITNTGQVYPFAQDPVSNHANKKQASHLRSARVSDSFFMFAYVADHTVQKEQKKIYLSLTDHFGSFYLEDTVIIEVAGEIQELGVTSRDQKHYKYAIVFDEYQTDNEVFQSKVVVGNTVTNKKGVHNLAQDNCLKCVSEKPKIASFPNSDIFCMIWNGNTSENPNIETFYRCSDLVTLAGSVQEKILIPFSDYMCHGSDIVALNPENELLLGVIVENKDSGAYTVGINKLEDDLALKDTDFTFLSEVEGTNIMIKDLKLVTIKSQKKFVVLYSHLVEGTNNLYGITVKVLNLDYSELLTEQISDQDKTFSYKYPNANPYNANDMVLGWYSNNGITLKTIKTDTPMFLDRDLDMIERLYYKMSHKVDHFEFYLPKNQILNYDGRSDSLEYIKSETSINCIVFDGDKLSIKRKDGCDLGVGKYNIEIVTKNECCEKMYFDFSLEITEEACDESPVLNLDLPDQNLYYLEEFAFKINKTTFLGANGNDEKELNYFAYLLDGEEKADLPSWMRFYSKQLLFEGTAPSPSNGNIDYTIQIECINDCGKSASETFTIHLEEDPDLSCVDSAIELKKQIQTQIAVPEFEFHFQIPNDLFANSGGNAHKIDLQISFEPELPSWLKYDSSNQLLSGHPDKKYAEYNVIVHARNECNKTNDHEFSLIIRTSRFCPASQLNQKENQDIAEINPTVKISPCLCKIKYDNENRFFTIWKNNVGTQDLLEYRFLKSDGSIGNFEIGDLTNSQESIKLSNPACLDNSHNNKYTIFFTYTSYNMNDGVYKINLVRYDTFSESILNQLSINTPGASDNPRSSLASNDNHLIVLYNEGNYLINVTTYNLTNSDDNQTFIISEKDTDITSTANQNIIKLNSNDFLIVYEIQNSSQTKSIVMRHLSSDLDLSAPFSISPENDLHFHPVISYLQKYDKVAVSWLRYTEEAGTQILANVFESSNWYDVNRNNYIHISNDYPPLQSITSESQAILSSAGLKYDKFVISWISNETSTIIRFFDHEAQLLDSEIQFENTLIEDAHNIIIDSFLITTNPMVAIFTDSNKIESKRFNFPTPEPDGQTEQTLVFQYNKEISDNFSLQDLFTDVYNGEGNSSLTYFYYDLSDEHPNKWLSLDTKNATFYGQAPTQLIDMHTLKVKAVDACSQYAHVYVYINITQPQYSCPGEDLVGLMTAAKDFDRLLLSFKCDTDVTHYTLNQSLTIKNRKYLEIIGGNYQSGDGSLNELRFEAQLSDYEIQSIEIINSHITFNIENCRSSQDCTISFQGIDFKIKNSVVVFDPKVVFEIPNGHEGYPDGIITIDDESKVRFSYLQFADSKLSNFENYITAKNSELFIAKQEINSGNIEDSEYFLHLVMDQGYSSYRTNILNLAENTEIKSIYFKDFNNYDYTKDYDGNGISFLDFIPTKRMDIENGWFTLMGNTIKKYSCEEIHLTNAALHKNNIFDNNYPEYEIGSLFFDNGRILNITVDVQSYGELVGNKEIILKNVQFTSHNDLSLQNPYLELQNSQLINTKFMTISESSDRIMSIIGDEGSIIMNSKDLENGYEGEITSTDHVSHLILDIDYENYGVFTSSSQKVSFMKGYRSEGVFNIYLNDENWDANQQKGSAIYYNQEINLSDEKFNINFEKWLNREYDATGRLIYINAINSERVLESISMDVEDNQFFLRKIEKNVLDFTFKGCPPGTSGDDLVSECDYCKEGHYNSLYNQNQCLVCPEGSYSATEGADECLPCKAGFYQPETGEDRCLPCGAGSYSDTEGKSQCELCSKGSYSEEGQTSCTPCSAGQYAASDGAKRCEKCENGEYSDQKGAAKCNKCELGTYTGSAIGDYSEGYTQCILCGLGQYSNKLGSSLCELCSEGTYNDNLGQSNCKSCAKGAYQNQRGIEKCVPCPYDTYQDTTGNSQCKSCAQNGLTLRAGSKKQTDCICEIGFYGEYGDSCHYCGEGANCTKSGITDPHAVSGYYKNELNEFIECKTKVACPGGKIGICNQDLGYQGYACNECAQGYFISENVCKKCPEGGILWRFLIAIPVVLVFCFIMFILAKRARSYFGSFIIAFSFLQILAIMNQLDLNWPTIVRTSFESISAVNFNIDLLAAECSFQVTWEQKWLIIVASPLFFFLVFFSFYIFIYVHSYFSEKINPCLHSHFPNIKANPTHRKNWKRIALIKRMLLKMKYYLFSTILKQNDSYYRKTLKNNLINAYSTFLTMIYLIVSLKVLEYFDCTHNDNGSWSMDAKPEWFCFEGEWMKLFPVALVALIGYVFGIPIIMGLVLRHYSTRLTEEEFDQKFGLLSARYSKNFYYWEIVIMLRKLAIVALQLMLGKRQFIQVSLCILVIFVAILLQLKYAPYLETRHNMLEFILLGVSDLVLFSGWIFLSGELTTDKDKVTSFSIIVVSIIWGSILCLGFMIICEVRYKYRVIKGKEQDESKYLKDVRSGKAIMKFCKSNPQFHKMLDFVVQLNETENKSAKKILIYLEKILSNDDVKKSELLLKYLNLKGSLIKHWKQDIIINIVQYYQHYASHSQKDFMINLFFSLNRYKKKGTRKHSRSKSLNIKTNLKKLKNKFTNKNSLSNETNSKSGYNSASNPSLNSDSSSNSDSSHNSNSNSNSDSSSNSNSGSNSSTSHNSNSNSNSDSSSNTNSSSSTSSLKDTSSDND